jgi:signal transduction histidine kinase/CheY-like chemotaxis protein
MQGATPQHKDIRADRGDGDQPQLPRLTRWLQPTVDAVARLPIGVHRKLLFGFLGGAATLLAMGVLSLVVIGRMDERIDELNLQEGQVSRAQQMLYDVTAQSHYRAMALLLFNTSHSEADAYDAKIATAKKDFGRLLTLMERDDPTEAATYATLRDANSDYAESSRIVEDVYRTGRIRDAMRLHIAREHTQSHVLEDALHPLIDRMTVKMDTARAGLATDRRFLTGVVLAFSGVSVVAALLVGFLLSWAIILPVKKIDLAFGRITRGDFTGHVSVPNRDELGRLADNLNRTSDRLAQLFDAQRQLSARLSESNASLERASEAKSRFLASVSHELRTPMNAIVGFTDALLAGLDGPLNPEQRTSLEWVQRGGRDLLALINEILDLSRVESGKLSLQPAPLAPGDLVASVVAQLQPLAEQEGLRLSCTVSAAPPEAMLDEQRLGQILRNLIGNALKFTDQGEVRVDVDSTEHAELHIAVRDTGPGIAVDKQESIFDEFAQGDDRVAGTGLGLAISRRLARAMGGNVTVDSQPGQGSTFHLVVPMDAPGSLPVTNGGPPADAGTERVLLSIDDDPAMAPLLQKMLAGSGYRVVAAAHPGEAVGEVCRLHPDAVLLDLLMPERDGNEVLRELRRDPATRPVPVLVLSVVDATNGSGLADAWLTKPVDKQALLAALGELEARREAR